MSYLRAWMLRSRRPLDATAQRQGGSTKVELVDMSMSPILKSPTRAEQVLHIDAQRRLEAKLDQMTK